MSTRLQGTMQLTEPKKEVSNQAAGTTTTSNQQQDTVSSQRQQAAGSSSRNRKHPASASSQQQQATPSSSKQQQAVASSTKQQQAKPSSSKQQQATPSSSKQNQAVASNSKQQQATSFSSKQQKAPNIRNTEPDVGDMIAFERVVYSHFAVYVGAGYVIHITGDKWSCCKSSGVGNPEVKKELLNDVAGRSNYIVNNTRDEEREADAPQTISDRAHAHIGNSKIKYNLTRFNCETFASMCRYGRGRSKQVGRFCLRQESVTDTDISPVRQRGQRSTHHEVQKDTLYEDGEDEDNT